MATITTANVKAVFSLLHQLSMKEYFYDTVPASRRAVIERGYPDPEAQEFALASYYANCFPKPLWEVHACKLYVYDEIAALEKLYTFHQRRQSGMYCIFGMIINNSFTACRYDIYD